ncbi:MAG: hypothetical protein H6554_03945 [Chitinophagales bacterium]|nr:hypothetical protein [Chitinophagales bacterium]
MGSAFYDSEMPNITTENACSSSWAFVDGDWIVDDTPTLELKNTHSAYILTVDGVDYNLGTAI